MVRLLSFLSLVCLVVGTAACPPADDEVEVTVLAILASEHHADVHPKLTEFAKHVQKKQPALTGYKLDRSTGQKLKLGETRKFPLSGNEVVAVTVNKERNEKGRITLTIKPPKLDQVTYECACNKYFSMATQHFEGKDKDRAQLFVAVMAKPCTVPKK